MPETPNERPVKLRKDGKPDGRSLRMMDPEHRRKMWAAKLAKAKEDPHAMGGRPRKPTREEAREHALETLWPKAYNRLNAILDDPRATPAQIIQVGKMLWEAKFGKAATAVDSDTQVTAIEYITTAMELQDRSGADESAA